MPRLRMARTKEEAANVPADQPIQIELEEAIAAETGTESPMAGDEPKVEAPQKARRAADIKIQPPREEPPETPEIPKEKDDVAALKAQVAALEKAEKANREALEAERRRAEDAIRRQNELQGESSKHQEEAIQAQYDAIINAIEASRAESESAQQALEQADLNGDSKAKSEAYKRLARAEANMAKLEDGKLAYEARIQQDKDHPKTKPVSHLDPLEQAIAPMPEPVKVWIRAHPEYMTNQRLNTKMQAVHYDVLDEGHTFGTPAYIESVERHLGLKEKPSAAPEDVEIDEPAPKPRNQVVTQAPPTRESVSVTTGKPQSSTKITLTPEQREIARLSGIDEVTYARNLQKLNGLKAQGHYNEGRG